MLTRRIAASACALCLAVPAVAAAKPGGPVHFHHVPVVATGDTKNDLRVDAYAKAIAGDTKGRLPRTIAPPPRATKPVAATPAVAGNGSDGWQIAAIAEAGVVAAFAFGTAAALSSRARRNAHPGM
jgi:hypothetical protein